ncbi:MAG: DNA polymerase III subunit gamma/tau [Chlorobi bacterium]|nr:DNA polymerase III subunit gamma/tau [Chlorobiota bacterium]MCI0715731.1 DNA polymerase III subunit gamma/tau [Chlorobiota bacterium]
MAELFNENSSYKVTARKWRPQRFEDVTSQEFITKTIRNAVKNNRISHAYLFSGPRGVGKTTVARLLAKTLNCTNRQADGEPCNQCPSCNEINNDNRNHPDVFEIDGASNRNIDDVRELKEKVKYGPVRSKYKIFIIDEVHMLTGASFNALLKTLEEPPPYIVFIFATTAPEKVPLTILGRCQKFDFKRLTIEEIKSRLRHIANEEKVKIDDESLFFLSKKGDGSMRDAQGLFDMAAAYSDNNITFDKLKSFFNLAESDVYFQITDLVKNKNANGILNYFEDLMNKGYDMQTFLDGLTEHYRNLLVAISTKSGELIMESDSVKQKYAEYSGKFTELEIINSLKLILQTEFNFKYSSNQRTLIEALLVELIKFTDTKDISQIIEDIKELRSASGSAGKLNQETSQSDDELKHGESQSKTEIKKANPPDEIQPQIRDNPQPAEIEQSAVSLTEAANDINSHWSSIKDQIRSERKWVYSIIKDSTCLSAPGAKDEKGNLVIQVDDSTYELVDGYKDYLSGKVSKYFGQTISINLVKNSEFVSSSTHDEKPPDKNNPQAAEENYEKIRSILIKELNAKEIN